MTSPAKLVAYLKDAAFQEGRGREYTVSDSEIVRLSRATYEAGDALVRRMERDAKKILALRRKTSLTPFWPGVPRTRCGAVVKVGDVLKAVDPSIYELVTVELVRETCWGSSDLMVRDAKTGKSVPVHASFFLLHERRLPSKRSREGRRP